jgi:hypothetical protein
MGGNESRKNKVIKPFANRIRTRFLVIDLSLSLSVCLSVGLSLSFCLSVCVSVGLFLSFCRTLSLSKHHYLFPTQTFSHSISHSHQPIFFTLFSHFLSGFSLAFLSFWIRFFFYFFSFIYLSHSNSLSQLCVLFSFF